ncbi:MAG: ATP-dependent DNA helicase RecG [Clostridia bacterium]|nr:ATP-dependent DNA helicase RecG [Clostridia bacterium]
MLNEKLTTIKGIGPRKAELLAKLGLFCLQDALLYEPADYIGLYGEMCISELIDTCEAFLRVIIIEPLKRTFFNGKAMVYATACDDTGRVKVCWFNQPYRFDQLKEGMEVWLKGRYDAQKKRIINPTVMHEYSGIQPIYSTIKGISQRDIKNIVRTALDTFRNSLEDAMPIYIRQKFELCELNFAVENLHYPLDNAALVRAKRRIMFDNLLCYFIMLKLRQNALRGSHGISFSISSELIAEFKQNLSFKLTSAQERVMEEIASDMMKLEPMNRLVQGDVGSGKTIVAIFAMYAAVKNGYQAVIMAPTDMLAQQHYVQLKRFFGDKACVLTGNMRTTERAEKYVGLIEGRYMAITGTHALIQEAVNFSNLGLIITDEQQRFGVAQRAALNNKGLTPDTIVMSATPIPRTLALIMYGDLDISMIDELPPDRKTIKTHIVTAKKRISMYRFIEERWKYGEQAYVVCPTIEGIEGNEHVSSAVDVYNELRQLLSVPVGLLHGQMSAAEKDAIMQQFRRGDIAVLVSTTVIEVGVDVPNATIMVIESAERFGLAQLHQLRGRVGRSYKQSWCFLLNSEGISGIAERLKVMTETTDGFIIAQRDLELRGCGEFLGFRQHGESELSVLTTDIQLIGEASSAAEMIIEDKPETAAKLCKKAEELLNSKSKMIIFN